MQTCDSFLFKVEFVSLANFEVTRTLYMVNDCLKRVAICATRMADPDEFVSSVSRLDDVIVIEDL